jgi:hypothetical protein
VGRSIKASFVIEIDSLASRLSQSEPQPITTSPGFSCALARLPIEKWALENFAERGVEKAIEPPDRIELLHVDIPVRHAGWIDVDINDFADDERMPVRPELEDAFELALEMDRNLFDTRCRDFDAWDRRETGLGKLGVVSREGAPP